MRQVGYLQDVYWICLLTSNDGLFLNTDIKLLVPYMARKFMSSVSNYQNLYQVSATIKIYIKCQQISKFISSVSNYQNLYKVSATIKILLPGVAIPKQFEKCSENFVLQ